MADQSIAELEYFIIERILKKVRKEAKQEGNRPHTLGVYRGSEIGGCGRALQYATLGYKGEIPSAETQLIFKDGHLHHHGGRELLAKVGTISHIEVNVSKTYKHNGQKFTITGTLDCMWNGMVCDVKSMSTFRFKYLDRDFPTQYQNYIFQLMMYMDIVSADTGFFLFKDKNSAELKVKIVEYDPKLVTQILDTIANLHRMNKLKEFVPRPYGVNTWHCKLCSFRQECWGVPMERKGWGAATGYRAQASQDRSGRANEPSLGSTLKASLKAKGKDL